MRAVKNSLFYLFFFSERARVCQLLCVLFLHIFLIKSRGKCGVLYGKFKIKWILLIIIASNFRARGSRIRMNGPEPSMMSSNDSINKSLVLVHWKQTVAEIFGIVHPFAPKNIKDQAD